MLYKNNVTVKPHEILAMYLDDTTNHLLHYPRSSLSGEWDRYRSVTAAEIREGTDRVVSTSARYMGPTDKPCGVYQYTDARYPMVDKPIDKPFNITKLHEVLEYIKALDTYAVTNEHLHTEGYVPVLSYTLTVDTGVVRIDGGFISHQVPDYSPFHEYVKDAEISDLKTVFYIPPGKEYQRSTAKIRWTLPAATGDKYEIYRVCNTEEVMDTLSYHCDTYVESAVVVARSKEEAVSLVWDTDEWRDLTNPSFPIFPEDVLVSEPLGLSYGTAPTVIDICINEEE